MPARLVDDVDAVVLPVRAGDAEEDRQPAPEPEAPLPGERPVEDELVPLPPEVPTGLLADAVHEDLEALAYPRREFYMRPLGHPS